MSPLRIVSLVPSITELIVDLGLVAHLVGRTGFCIHPANAVRSIPKVGGTKNVQLDKLRLLCPSHVVVNVDENERPDAEALSQFVPHVVVTHPQTPQDNVQLVDQLVSAFSVRSAADNALLYARAQQLKAALTARLTQLSQALPARRQQRVLYLIWRAPWMTVARDTYISRMLALIGWNTWPEVQGGDGITTQGATRYPALAGDEPWLGQIDRVLLSSEPYKFNQQHVQEVHSWLRSQGAQTQVQLVDGELISWYGSRAVAGLDYLEFLSTSAGTALPATPPPPASLPPSPPKSLPS